MYDETGDLNNVDNSIHFSLPQGLVRITLQKTSGNHAYFGFSAPKAICILRKELIKPVTTPTTQEAF